MSDQPAELRARLFTGLALGRKVCTASCPTWHNYLAFVPSLEQLAWGEASSFLSSSNPLSCRAEPWQRVGLSLGGSLRQTGQRAGQGAPGHSNRAVEAQKPKLAFCFSPQRCFTAAQRAKGTPQLSSCLHQPKADKNIAGPNSEPHQLSLQLSLSHTHTHRQDRGNRTERERRVWPRYLYLF